MPEHEPQQFRSCEVCGRTILRGERIFDYLTPDRDHRGVCSLCRARAEADDWVRADSPAARAHATEPRRRRGLRAAKLRERVARASERVRAPRGPEPSDATPPEPRRRARPTVREPEPRAAPKAEPPAPPPEPPPPPPPPPLPETPARRMRRAVLTFNESAEARMVAGLIRSLGEPQAAVRDTSREPPRAEIIVAWELSWYRWEALLDSDEIRELAKGSELSELEDGEPKWNAQIDEDGRLLWDESSS